MGRAATDLPDPLQQTSARPAPGQPLSDLDVPADDLISQMAGEQIDRLLAEAGAPTQSEPLPIANEAPADETAGELVEDAQAIFSNPDAERLDSADVAAFVSAVESTFTGGSEATDTVAAEEPSPIESAQDPAPAAIAESAAPATIDPPATIDEAPAIESAPVPEFESPAAIDVIAAPEPTEVPAPISLVEPPAESPVPAPIAAEPTESAPTITQPEVPPTISIRAESPESIAPAAEPPAAPAVPDAPTPIAAATPNPVPKIAAASPIEPSTVTASEERQALKLDLDLDSLPLQSPPVRKSASTSAAPAKINRLVVVALKAVNAPAQNMPDELREILGKTALVTMFNAVAVIVYVLFFRHHH